MPDVCAQRPADQVPGHDLHPVPLLQLYGGRGHLPVAAVLQPAGAGPAVADGVGPVPRTALALPGARPEQRRQGDGGAATRRAGEIMLL